MIKINTPAKTTITVHNIINAIFVFFCIPFPALKENDNLCLFALYKNNGRNRLAISTHHFNEIEDFDSSFVLVMDIRHLLKQEKSSISLL